MTEPARPPEGKVWRTLELIRVTVPYLEGKGVDAARLCAEMLLAHALSCERIQLYAHFEKPVPDDAVSRFRELVRRRAAREPVQHILGQTAFHAVTIRCDPRALVPRPETEDLVDAALELASDLRDPAFADVGTGTGCVAVALAAAREDASVVASDISADALALAGENLALNGLADRVLLLKGDLAAPFLERGLADRFDVVVSNPPYVADAEMADLQPEVREHDPEIALRGGPDGLDILRRLARDAPRLLKPGGWLVMEIGHRQADAVRSTLANEGWSAVQFRTDGAGIARIVVARSCAADSCGADSKPAQPAD